MSPSCHFGPCLCLGAICAWRQGSLGLEGPLAALGGLKHKASLDNDPSVHRDADSRNLPPCWGLVSQNPGKWACISACPLYSQEAQRQVL